MFNRALWNLRAWLLLSQIFFHVLVWFCISYPNRRRHSNIEVELCYRIANGSDTYIYIYTYIYIHTHTHTQIAFAYNWGLNRFRQKWDAKISPAYSHVITNKETLSILSLFFWGPSIQDNYCLGYWDVLNHIKIILQRYTPQTIEQHEQDSCHKSRLTGHSLAFSHNIENQPELAGVKFLDSHLTE